MESEFASVSLNVFRDLAVAGALGMLMGMEREWSEVRAGEPTGFAGARTFTLAALLGALSVKLALGTGVIIAALGLLGGITIVAYWADVSQTPRKGATTEVALLMAFCIGAIAARGQLYVASGVAIAITALLSAKAYTQAVARTLTETEVRAGLRFLVISIIILPLAPNTGFGPYAAINPRDIWLMVTLITGLSFAGYWLTKWLGPSRGVLLTGLLGGLASSSAATLSLSRMARTDAIDPRNAGAGIVAAAMMMVVRASILVAVISMELFSRLWPGLVTLVASGLLISLGLAFSASITAKASEEIRLRNPLEISSALSFSLVLAAVTLLTAWASDQFGDAALYSIAAIAGLVDVDAVTIAASRQAAMGTTIASVASLAVIIAISVNTLAKGLIALIVAGLSTARIVLPALLAALLAGGAVLLLSEMPT